MRRLALLAIFLALPASAERLLIPPATFTWTPATGPVAGYEVQALTNGAWAAVATVPATTVAMTTPLATKLQLRVRAYSAAGATGLWSDSSEAFSLYPNADCNGDGYIGLAELGCLRATFGSHVSHGELLP